MDGIKDSIGIMMRGARVGRDMAEGLDYAGSGVDIDLETDEVGPRVRAVQARPI